LKPNRGLDFIYTIPNTPMSANTPAILTWGTKLCKDLNLASSRRQFTYEFPQPVYDTARDVIIGFLQESLGLAGFNPDDVVIVHKTLPETGLKWHIDDCQITNRKEPPSYNLEQYIHLEGSKYLYFNTPTKRLPRFTVLFYSSTFGEDFTGGILCLSDGVQVFPKAGYGYMMDSREVHMVTPVKSGVRRVSVVKIY
jgi:hypothetical protein